jgi:hypothetical protein
MANWFGIDLCLQSQVIHSQSWAFSIFWQNIKNGEKILSQPACRRSNEEVPQFQGTNIKGIIWSWKEKMLGSLAKWARKRAVH